MGPHDLVGVDKHVIGESEFLGVVSIGLHMSDVDPHAPLIAGYNHPTENVASGPICTTPSRIGLFVAKRVACGSKCPKDGRGGPNLLRVLNVVPRIVGSKTAMGVAFGRTCTIPS